MGSGDEVTSTAPGPAVSVPPARRRGPAAVADHESVRAALIAAAMRQLSTSADGSIATRAVCDEVGVTQPVLYRLFGDKDGLLDAVVTAGLEGYAARKEALETTSDAVADLYAGWDDHMAFARENPALYQLMFVPRTSATRTAHDQILVLLEATLLRCAAAGRLATTPRLAAQLILSASVGFGLSIIARPALFDDPALSDAARGAAFSQVLLPPAETSDPAPNLVAATARQLRAQLEVSGTTALEGPEVALLQHWLHRLEQGETGAPEIHAVSD